MKLLYLVAILGVILSACEDKADEVRDEGAKTQEVAKKELTPMEKISKRWVLVKRTNIKGDKVLKFDNENTSTVITFFEDNGYFRVYDSLRNIGDTPGVKRIEPRNSGQWEIESDELLLRFTKPDTVILERMTIQKLDEKELHLKSETKDQINYYERKD
ncbi:MAG: hypothetical protein R3277_10705 [Brumimicrobium sp.]|nr:hypothetical protein [Brumimicrobium sp.]